MVTTSFTALRRYAGVICTLLFLSVSLCVGAVGQSAPLVTASFAAGLSHPTGWGTLQQSAIDSYGDWLVADFPNGGLYEFPAGGGAAIILVPQGGLGSVGGYQNPSIAIDPDNNIYVGANFNNCLLEYPYDPVTHTWDGLAALNSGNASTAVCPNSTEGTSPNIFAHYNLSGSGYPGYFQPWGIAIGNNDNMIIGSQNSGNFIFSLAVNNAWTNPSVGTVTMLIASTTKRPISVAQDPEGNVYFVEDTGGLPGLMEIPAGSADLASDTGLARVDPNLPSVSGVITDASGNLYISDSTDGVFMVPNPAGTPQTASAVALSAVPAAGEVAIDWARNLLYIPTSQTQNNGKADVAMVEFNYAELGSSAIGTGSATGTVAFSFNGGVTPASFAIEEAGVKAQDFSITGGTCATGIAYAAGSSCTESIVLNPTKVGSISAKLLMLDAKNNLLASIILHGTGLGANIQASPALESTLSGSLKAPSQVAVDAAENIYVADAGLKQVLMYAAGGSGTPLSLGTGLTAPTGVAVDGGGDVFIADSGNVYELPVGSTGLNQAGQLALVTGLGANLKLAADGIGDLYVADPANARVLKFGNLGSTAAAPLAQTQTSLTTGFTTPSSVAVDSNNNLYVIDGSNLFEVAAGSTTPATLLNDLSNGVGLAVDPSGAVYVSSTGGTVRIPFAGSVLVPANEIAIATTVTNPTALAIDNMGNVYLTDGTAENVHVVTTNGSLNFGSLATPTSTASDKVTLINEGNAPLSVTGYTNNNTVDYAATDVSCVSSSPIAAGGTCQADVTLDPGPGDQGTLTSQIGFKSNANDGGVLVNATGVGAGLAASVSSITVGSTAEVVNTPVTVTVTPSTGTGVPTGQVTVTFTTTSGTTASVTATLNNGSATLTLSPAAAGSQKFSVAYAGDRVFGRSSATSTSVIAKSASVLALPANPPSFLPYVLEQDGSTPYDGSTQYWQYLFTVTVSAAVGQPTGTVTFNDNSSTLNYTGVACPASASGTQSLNSAGQAIFPTACLPMPQNVTYTPMVSTHVITPVYGGDANYLGFTGTPTTFIAVRSPAVQITSSVSSLSISSGSSASANLTLTSILGYGFAGNNAQLNNYTLPLSLSCSNLPPHAVCTFTYPNPDANIPTAVDIPCSGTTAQADDCTPGAVIVTINTNVSAGTTTSQLAHPATLAYAAMFGFGMVGLFFRRRIKKGGQMLLMVCLSLLSGALAISLTACSTANLSPSTVLSTPSGTYAVTITAQQVGQVCVPVVGASNCLTGSGGPGISVYGSQNQVSLPFTLNVTVQ